MSLFTMTQIVFASVVVFLVIFCTISADTAPLLSIESSKTKEIRPDEFLDIKIIISRAASISAGSIELDIQIFDEKGIILSPSIKRESKPLIKDGGTLYATHSVQLNPRMKPGDYTMNVSVDVANLVLGPASIQFSVKKINSEIETYEDIINDLFSRSKNITLKNKGNAPSLQIIQEEIPWYLNFFTSTYPKDVVIKKGKDVYIYEWAITIEPFEVTYVYYHSSYVPLLAILIAIILGVVVILQKSEFLTLSKEIVSQKHHRDTMVITIALHIKNFSEQVREKIVIQDIVPSLAKVNTDFDMLKPSIKKTDGIITLEWIIPSLEPNEERVISYSIETQYKIYGAFELPQAKLIYSIEEDNVFTSSSNRVKCLIEEDVEESEDL